MTLDEAIKHCLEVAEQNTQGLYDAIALGGQNPTQEEIARCEECAADHRQLAEWLTELKEAKQLLKAAVEDMEQANQKGRCSTCFYNLHNAKGLIGKCQACHYFSLWKWKNEAEALALIGEDGEQNG